MKYTLATARRILLVVTTALFAAGALAKEETERHNDPKKTDADFAFQGEYEGLGVDGRTYGFQIIAQGDGKFEGVLYRGGLPGHGWDKERKYQASGRRSGEIVRLTKGQYTVDVTGKSLTVFDGSKNELGKLSRTERASPTLGASPPDGSLVLFDGTKDSLENWEKGRLSDDRLLMEGTTSRQKFGDHQLHLEFRLAYQPGDRGQGRSNSGLYLQGRYEVQILDSFGLTGEQNECGGIYSVKKPDVNMCLPPLTWQTYDVDFTAAKYDAAGAVTSAPHVTVRHNGVVIHDEVELPADRSTTAAPVKPGPEPGPLYLQDHNCPLRFRNIWVVAK